MACSSIEFAQFSLELFNDVVLGNKDYVDLILSDPYQLLTYNMGLVDGEKSQPLSRDDMRRGLFGRRSVHAMSALVCGLDVYRRYPYATILGPDGSILAQRSIGNEEVPAFLSSYRWST